MPGNTQENADSAMAELAASMRPQRNAGEYVDLSSVSLGTTKRLQ